MTSLFSRLLFFHQNQQFCIQISKKIKKANLISLGLYFFWLNVPLEAPKFADDNLIHFQDILPNKLGTKNYFLNKHMKEKNKRKRENQLRGC